jgi:hypothetical protein
MAGGPRRLREPPGSCRSIGPLECGGRRARIRSALREFRLGAPRPSANGTRDTLSCWPIRRVTQSDSGRRETLVSELPPPNACSTHATSTLRCIALAA